VLVVGVGLWQELELGQQQGLGNSRRRRRRSSSSNKELACQGFKQHLQQQLQQRGL
jgi:hypothetical protein